MSTPGVKPTPLELRLVRGMSGKRDMPAGIPAPPPVAPEALPEPPPEMSEQARAYWPGYARDLAAMRVLALADATALAALCEATATYWECTQRVREQGLILKAQGKNGEYFIRNPFATEANNAWLQMMRLLTEFGLTPSARVRVRTES